MNKNSAQTSNPVALRIVSKAKDPSNASKATARPPAPAHKP